MLENLQALYTNYAETVKEIRKKAKPFDGFLGFGNDPRKDPCHEAFYEAVAQWAEGFAAQQPQQEALLTAAFFLLEEPLRYREQECYWYMFAAHAHLKPLIPLLTRENARCVQARFEELYPKRERMPLQKELLKLLTKAGK